jgi:tetratricopeptide (TPR) repeat protein
LQEIADAIATEPRLHLLLVLRDEAIEMIAPALGNVVIHDVKSLTVDAAVEAAAKPLALTDRSFAADAAVRLVTGLTTYRDSGPGGFGYRDETVQPSLLQVVCAGLWRSLPPDVRRITTREVRLYGDPDTALAAHCGAVISAVADQHDLPASRLRTWLLENFVTEHGTLGAAYEGAGKTKGMPNSVLHALTDSHLLKTELRKGTRWYELLTERLIEPLRQARDTYHVTPSATACLSAAERAFALGDLPAAELYADATLRTASDTDLPVRAQLESLRGNIEREHGNLGEAARHHRHAAQLFEVLQDATAVATQLAAVGRLLLAQEMPDEAIDELSAAVQRMPNDPVMQLDLGEALWHKGDGQTAVAYFSRVLSADGSNRRALRARGEILADLGNARDALLDLDRVMLQGHPATRAARGLALAALGDRAGADREIRQAVAEAPRNGTVLLRAARAKESGDDEPYAEELARRAVDATDPPLPPQQREEALRLATHKEEKDKSPN